MKSRSARLLSNIGANDRGVNYVPSKTKELWVASGQASPPAVVTGQTSFVATTPTFLATQTTAGKRAMLRRLSLTQAGTVAGGQISVAIAIDLIDRFASAGTERTPVAPNADNADAASFNWYENPTAAAASSIRWLDAFELDANVGETLELLPADGIQLVNASSLLVYTWAATTGPSWHYAAEFVEEPS